ncbi:STAS domain-containing protein [Desulfotomaculum nigrificans]|uniref:STAS domain-containing protein n=1 Tax=Desulfotomaculum nigrificans TaxID=1565 RepID=UPI0001FADE57|nr:STAS domain-containing protein [Desulfotomaculum nigrificans]
MLNIKTERQKGKISFSLSGQFDMGTADILEDAVEKEDLTGVQSIAFVLSKLEFIDSTGIGELIKYYRKFACQGITMELINENPEIEEVLELIGVREIMAEN